ncbi:hypothetical protein GGR55DRAFT_11964 [Xylaria sp. FL0064]|nr:hypothetical protein GGR55DRAFT_11964 [Xylaria sp. FL0064]
MKTTGHDVHQCIVIHKYGRLPLTSSFCLPTSLRYPVKYQRALILRPDILIPLMASTSKYDIIDPESDVTSDIPGPNRSLLYTELMSWKVKLVVFLLIALTSANVVLLFWQAAFFLTLTRGADASSYYAGLERDTPVQIYPSTTYTSDNLTEVVPLWEKVSGDLGVVALSTEYLKGKQLPHALRFPWDTTKGVYLLQGFHNLHCLRTLFRYVMYTEQKLPQRIAMTHALHCLDQLRQDVICNADDTPRYAGFQNPPGTGAGQVRMCKDWSRLEAWALEHTACFRHEDEVPGPMIERFKSCPDGRVLWPGDGPR